MSGSLGKQIFVEFYNCSTNVINDVAEIEKFMNIAALKANATIIKSIFHKFAPQGVSGVIVIAESHFAIHTWPEHNYASLDLFTCGNKINELNAIQFLKKKFVSNKYEIKKINRGDMSKIYREKNNI